MSKEAKPDAWMPLFIGDYKKDTGRLTRDQHGGYMLLIMEYWNTGPLQDDDQELAAIALADAKAWKALRPKLERFFIIADGVWRHKRIDAELSRWSERKVKFIERAKAAAAARWGEDGAPSGPKTRGRNKAKSNASSTGQALHEQCPLPLPREVDAPTGQSTLSAEDSISDLKKASLDDERSWAFAISEAERDELRCRRSDPDLNSELCEFIAHAKSTVAGLRRARLNIGEPSNDHAEIAA